MGEKEFLYLAKNEFLVDAIQRKEEELGNWLTRKKIKKNLRRICKLVFSAIKNIETRKGHNPHAHGLELIRKAKKMAKMLGCPPAEVELIGCAACLHDIGKSMLDRDIVNKPSQLSFAEYKEVQQHVIIGERIVRPFAYLGKLVRHHHERVDGKGYPDGLNGEEIPLGSRILAVIDSYNAIRHHRKYYPSRPKKFAINELKRCAEMEFDKKYLTQFRMAFVRSLVKGGGKEVYARKLLAILCKKGEFNPRKECRKSIKELEQDYLYTRLRSEKQFDSYVLKIFLRTIR